MFLLFNKFNLSLDNFHGYTLSKRYVFFALLVGLIFTPIISTNRWKLFLSVSGIQESTWSLWRINWISAFLGLVLPSAQGFDVIRMYYIEQRHPEYRGKPGSTVLIERMLGLGLLCSLSLCAFPFLDNPPPLTIFIILAVCLSGFAAIMLVLHPFFYKLYATRKSSNKFLNRALSFIQSTHAAIINFPFRQVMLSSLLLIACFQLLTVLSVYFIFRAYGYHIPFIKHLALYPIIGTLSLVPITIGGFGVREGFFVYFYNTLGIPAEISISVSIVNYLVLTLVPALFGGLFLLLDSFKTDKLLTAQAQTIDKPDHAL